MWITLLHSLMHPSIPNRLSRTLQKTSEYLNSLFKTPSLANLYKTRNISPEAIQNTLIFTTPQSLSPQDTFSVKEGARNKNTFLLKENKVNLSQNKTGYFKMGKRKHRTKCENCRKFVKRNIERNFMYGRTG